MVERSLIDISRTFYEKRRILKGDSMKMEGVSLKGNAKKYYIW